MKSREQTIPIEWVKIIGRVGREGRFHQALQDMGFKVSRGNFILDEESWHLSHTALILNITLFVKEQAIVGVGHGWNYAKGLTMTYETIIGKLKQLIREIATTQLNKLDHISL